MSKCLNEKINLWSLNIVCIILNVIIFLKKFFRCRVKINYFFFYVIIVFYMLRKYSLVIRCFDFVDKFYILVL